MPLTMSHIAARQEVRELLSTLNLPGVEKGGRRRLGRPKGTCLHCLQGSRS